MLPLKDLESDLARALGRLEPRTTYAEVMAETSEGSRVRVDREATNPQPVPKLEGAVFRAWAGDLWVETATSGLSPHTLREAVDQLLGHLPGPLVFSQPPGPSPSGRAERSTKEHRPIADLSLEDQIAWARTRFDWATSVPGIENAFVTVLLDRDERMFLSTAGAIRFQSVTRALGSVAPLAMEGGKVEFDAVQRGECGGAEVLDRVTQDEVLHAAREAKALLSAKSPPSGPTTVILDPSTAGTFAHESFGHGTEADQIVRNRSYLGPLLGQKVGPECLTIVDGLYDGGWGTIYFDDEGQPAQRTVLVDHGRFVEVLHDRESAALMERAPTGNTRRADFLSRPFVRMTNTFVEPGDLTFEELVTEAKEGVVLQNFTSGIEDPLGGNMQLKVKKGRRIEHGELTDILPSMALSGKVLEFLTETRGVSRKEDFRIFAGFCGKGHTDILPTGAGGPYVLSRAVVGPA